MHSLLGHLLKIIGTIAATLVGLIGLAAGALWYFTQDLCANSVLAESVAPGGRIKAVVFGRDCGATTDFSTQVSILSASESLPNEPGNVFVADRGHGKAPGGPGGGPAIRVTWFSEQKLRIEHHPLARILKSEPMRKNITVEYVVVNSDD